MRQQTQLPQRFVCNTREFWESMVKGSAPIQMMKKGFGEELWREKKARAGLVGRDTAYAEGAADFGCVVGGGH